jgi:ligand-binding SRPBCC domain-containing protein
MYKIERKISLPIAVPEAWKFFSDPENLSNICPPKVDFVLTSKSRDGEMYEGQIITYKLKPLFGIYTHWMTEIVNVEKHQYFIDEQKMGPYRLWHHEHYFKEVDGGTEIIDIIYYAIPGWIIGRLLHSLFIKQKLAEIFDYREKMLKEKFVTDI